MSTANLVNITGFSNFILAINNEASGVLLTGLLFVFFLIVMISLFSSGSRTIWEILAISGVSTTIPALLMTTLSYNNISAVKIWTVILFILITAAGTGGMYFAPKN